MKKEGLIMNLMTRFFQEEEGQGLTEYALIIAGVSIALIITLGLFKNKIIAVFTNMTF
jgi:pilus assembly protein Flp/PilA